MSRTSLSRSHCPHGIVVDEPCRVCNGELTSPLASSIQFPRAPNPNSAPPAQSKNSWEKGVWRDDRGVPIRVNGKVVPVKDLAAKRAKYEEGYRQIRAGNPVNLDQIPG